MNHEIQQSATPREGEYLHLLFQCRYGTPEEFKSDVTAYVSAYGSRAFAAEREFVSESGTSLATAAVLSGSFEKLTAVVESGASFAIPNKKGLVPLDLALRQGDIGMSELIVEKGKDRLRDNHLLILAANGHGEHLGRLWTKFPQQMNDLNPNVVEFTSDECGDTPLIKAVKNSRSSFVTKFLTVYGFDRVDVNLRDAQGYTAALWASSRGLYTILCCLLRGSVHESDKARPYPNGGANPYAVTPDGKNLGDLDKNGVAWHNADKFQTDF